MPRHSSTANTVDPAVAEQLKTFNEGVTKRAEEIVFKTFPQKYRQLSEQIEKAASSDSPYHISNAEESTDATVYPPPASSEPPTKKRRHENGDASVSSQPIEQGEGGPRFLNRVVANHKLRSLHDGLKKEYMELVDLCDKVKLWVNLTMPKIEDGDNFGVQIQEGKTPLSGLSMRRSG
ncbi:proteasome activator pa28 beta subunit [Ceratobasidium sp. AG-Ba]|nr:proteasome activator pa28 beta subunit [Ceratobasidium sp. AG-Ba]